MAIKIEDILSGKAKATDLKVIPKQNTNKPTPIPVKKKILEEAFDTEESYIDKFKDGNVKGGVANFVGSGMQAAQSGYLNILNNANSLVRGEGLQPFKYNMGYNDYAESVSKGKTITEILSETNPKLGAAYNFGMEVATDPLNLLDAGAAVTAKGLKTLGSAEYAKDLLKGGKTFVRTGKTTKIPMLVKGKEKTVKITSYPDLNSANSIGSIGDRVSVNQPRVSQILTKAVPTTPDFYVNRGGIVADDMASVNFPELNAPIKPYNATRRGLQKGVAIEDIVSGIPVRLSDGLPTARNIESGMNGQEGLKPSVDIPKSQEYNVINGGVLNDSNRNIRAGLQESHKLDRGTSQGWGFRRGNPGVYGSELVPENARQILTNKGVTDLRLKNTSDNNAIFVSALDEMKKADAKHGAYVDPHTVEDLAESGAKTFLSEDGFAGIAVKADGDITGAFKHPSSQIKFSSDDLMITALSNGGKKLDCYGERLAKKYASYGFEPVARVKFDKLRAPDDWNYANGEPDIYVMKHNGDSVDKVAENIDLYKIPTNKELSELPLMEYDDAIQYRNGLIPNRNTYKAKTEPLIKEKSPATEKIILNESKSDLGLKQSDEFLGDIKYSDSDIESINLIKSIANEKGTTPSKLMKAAVKNRDKEYQKIVDGVAKEYSAYKPKGVELIPDLTKEEGRFYRSSNNAKWYSDFSKDHNRRKPNKAEIRELAEETVKAEIRSGGGEYVSKEFAQSYNTIEETARLFENIPDDILKVENVNGKTVATFGKEVEIPKVDYSKAKGERVAVKTVTPNEVKGTPLDTTQEPVRVTTAQTTQSKANIPKAEKGASNTSKSVQDGLERDLGADTNRSGKSYAQDVKEFGVMPKGERAFDEAGNDITRDVDVPNATEYGDVMQNARTQLESPIIDDTLAREIKEAIEAGDYTKATKGNKTAVDNANKVIEGGLDDAYKGFKNNLKLDKTPTSEDIALGYRLVQELQKAGDYEKALDVSGDVASMLSETGRTLQAARIIKKLTPEGRLMTAQKTAKKLSEKYGVDVKISDKTAKKISSAKTEKEIAETNHEVAVEMWDQVPPRLQDKLNAWRYMAMLTNPKTHVRNMVGNALFMPFRGMKNIVGTGLEAGFAKAGKLENRTKAVLNPVKDKEILKFADDDFLNVKSILKGEGKYDDNVRKLEARVFKSKVLEGIKNFNMNTLDKEDTFFMRKAYKSSLAQYMKSNNLKPSAMTGETLAKARSYASLEALRATYRDANAFSDGITKLKKTAANSDHVLGRAGGVVLESMLPFTKTPINILRRGIEYSPLGIVKGLTDTAQALKKGEIRNMNEAIDRLSKGLTGTGVVLLGWYLSKDGIVDATSEGSNKETNYDSMTGVQDYSINFEDGSYTIDWAAPISLPFFLGVQLQKSNEDDEDNRVFASLVEALSSMGDPLFELSMLQGLTNIITETGYGTKGDKVTSAISNMTTNYLGQYVPTVLGQVARTADDSRRTTTSTDVNTNIRQLERAARKNIGKIPVASTKLQPYVDLWGRTDTKWSDKDYWKSAFENFLSPGYISEKSNDPVDSEIKNLAEKMGSEAIPSSVSNYTVKFEGKEYRMSEEDLTDFKVNKGQYAYDEVRKLISTSEYRNASDSDKLKMVKRIYEDAGDYAKKKYILSQGVTETDYNYSELSDSKKQGFLHASSIGVTKSKYLDILKNADPDGNKYYKKDDVISYMKSQGYTYDQAYKVYKVLRDSDDWVD